MRSSGLLALAACLLLVGCGKKDAEVAQTPAAEKPKAAEQAAVEPPPAEQETPKIPTLAGDTVTTPSGLKYIEMTVGTGEMPQADHVITADYTGWLTNGTLFDSSRLRGQPLVYPLAKLVKGWQEGIGSMKVGGRRLLIVPPNLGYGASGMGGVIPPNATLIFDVELIGTQAPAKQGS
jgi:peptidylprolyl isomerase